MKVLITGANGFLGSHIVEKSITKGFETFAGVRSGANFQNLEDFSGYQVLNLDYSSSDALTEQLKSSGPFDLIIHNAGLTKSFKLEKYIRVNVGITERLLKAISESKALSPTGKFVYVSSMAAKGPVGNNGPASYYGESKLKAEQKIKASGLPYMIYRPAGVYGARDIQFIPLIKSIKLGLYPLMTPKDHRMALINARDVAENILEISLKASNKIIHLDDGHVYRHKDMKGNMEKLLNKKSYAISLPKPLILFFLFFSDIVDRLLGRMPKVSTEQYHEISGNWDYDFTQERKENPLKIEFDLYDGFKDALDYYRKKKLI